jgi:hypothetical protein
MGSAAVFFPDLVRGNPDVLTDPPACGIRVTIPPAVCSYRPRHSSPFIADERRRARGQRMRHGGLLHAESGGFSFLRSDFRTNAKAREGKCSKRRDESTLGRYTRGPIGVRFRVSYWARCSQARLRKRQGRKSGHRTEPCPLNKQ